MSQELLIDVVDLHGMLADLAQSAGTDETLPMLNGVLLHTDTPTVSTTAGHTSEHADRVLVGTSTDRFLLGQAHAPATGHLPETFVPLCGVRVLVAALQPGGDTVDGHGEECEDDGDPLSARPCGPPSGPVARLVRDEDTLTVSIAGDMSIRVGVSGAEFPSSHLPRLFTSAATGTTASIAPVVWHKLETIADRRGVGVTFTAQAWPKPIRAHIGDRYRALVLPLNPRSVTPAPPAFMPPSCAHEATTAVGRVA